MIRSHRFFPDVPQCSSLWLVIGRRIAAANPVLKYSPCRRLKNDITSGKRYTYWVFRVKRTVGCGKKNSNNYLRQKKFLSRQTLLLFTSGYHLFKGRWFTHARNSHFFYVFRSQVITNLGGSSSAIVGCGLQLPLPMLMACNNTNKY